MKNSIFKYIFIGDTATKSVLYEYPSKLENYFTKANQLFNTFSTDKEKPKNELNKISKTNEVFFFEITDSQTFYFVVTDCSLIDYEDKVHDLIRECEKSSISSKKTNDGTLTFLGIKTLEDIIEKVTIIRNDNTNNNQKSVNNVNYEASEAKGNLNAAKEKSKETISDLHLLHQKTVAINEKSLYQSEELQKKTHKDNSCNCVIY